MSVQSKTLTSEPKLNECTVKAYLNDAPEHNARGGRGEVVAGAVQRGVGQECGCRLEADLQER